ncbi:MAG: phosphotransferase [Gemmobacter sp.]
MRWPTTFCGADNDGSLSRLDWRAPPARGRLGAMDWTADRIAAFLNARDLVCAFDAVRPLAGGYWNAVFRADTAAGALVVKAYVRVMPGTLFPNLPEAEAAALVRLRGLGVAPDPVGFWPDEGVLVYRYVPGAPWDGDVAAVAALLRRKAAADPAGFRAVPVTAEGMLATGARMLADCAPDDMAARLGRLRPAPQRAPALDRLSLIHTDIGAGNLIGRGAGLRLIDWQCPAAGDAAEDAASFLSPAFQILNHRPPLAAAARADFLAALDDPAMEQRLAVLEPAHAWRMATYCLRRAQTAPDSAVRARYAAALAAEFDRLEGWR